MKNCVKCTSPLNDNDRFCPICGAEQITSISNNFCVSCGSPITHNSQACTKCGTPIRNEQTQYIFKQAMPTIIRSLSGRIMLSAIIWLVISSLQLFCGVLLLCIASLTFSWNEGYIFAMIVYFLLGAINLKEGISLLKYKNSILSNYVGIVWENRICFATSINYIWNAYVVLNGFVAGNIIALLFGFITAGAIIIDFTGIQLYVKKNKESFLQLERAQLSVE